MSMKRKLAASHFPDSSEDVKHYKKRKLDQSRSDQISCCVDLENEFNKLPAGKILIFGTGEAGQLGLGDQLIVRRKPYPLTISGEDSNSFVKVVCGGMHSIAITRQGKAYSWGCSDEGSLGRSTDDIPENVPGLVELPSNQRIFSASCGDDHSAFLTESGSVYWAGAFKANTGIFRSHPVKPNWKVRLLYQDKDYAVSIISGSTHISILTVSGRVLTCGCSEQGQLGRMSKRQADSLGGRQGLDFLEIPSQVMLSKASKKNPAVKCLISGGFSTIVLTASNKVIVWGSNPHGHLGIESDPDSFLYYTPTQTDALSDYFANSIESQPIPPDRLMAVGLNHLLFISQKKLFACGSGNGGILGNGKVTFRTHIPLQVTHECFENDPPVKVACGDFASFTITLSGKLYSWGIGCNLQLGHTEEGDHLVPKQVVGKNLTETDEVLQVSSGGQHTMIIVKPVEEVSIPISSDPAQV